MFDSLLVISVGAGVLAAFGLYAIAASLHQVAMEIHQGNANEIEMWRQDAARQDENDKDEWGL